MRLPMYMSDEAQIARWAAAGFDLDAAAARWAAFGLERRAAATAAEAHARLLDYVRAEKAAATAQGVTEDDSDFWRIGSFHKHLVW